jgi:hypothetical protein
MDGCEIDILGSRSNIGHKYVANGILWKRTRIKLPIGRNILGVGMDLGTLIELSRALGDSDQLYGQSNK